MSAAERGSSTVAAVAVVASVLVKAEAGTVSVSDPVVAGMSASIFTLCAAGRLGMLRPAPEGVTLSAVSSVKFADFLITKVTLTHLRSSWVSVYVLEASTVTPLVAEAA